MAQKAEPGKEAGSLRELQAQSRARMDKAIEDLKTELAHIRTGRASISLLDQIRIDYYGTPTPLNQVGNLSVPEPNMIQIQPWDVSQIGAIEKSIRSSDLGLNPMNDGKLVRVPIPALTEERRKEMVKRLHHVLEEHRVAIRNIRRDANESVKKLFKDKKITEDEDRRALDEMQKITDDYIKKVDELGKAKEKDLMHV